jgi:hypothetical protein
MLYPKPAARDSEASGIRSPLSIYQIFFRRTAWRGYDLSMTMTAFDCTEECRSWKHKEETSPDDISELHSFDFCLHLLSNKPSKMSEPMILG